MIINGKKFTIGADPEIFAQREGKFISAHNLIPGSKINPHKIKNGAVQVDGMAMEFNIDPSDSLEKFKENLTSVQSTLKDMIGDAEFLKQVSVSFDEEFAKHIPPENLLLGCSPDFDGWTCSQIEPPNALSFMRTAGGHIHIGGFRSKNPYRHQHFEKCARLARLMDYTLGIYSIFWDDDDTRRSMYGRAGSFRPKSYGMEYRTLSNKWIFDEGLVEFVYEGTKKAIELLFTDFEPDPHVAEIINNSDRSVDIGPLPFKQVA